MNPTVSEPHRDLRLPVEPHIIGRTSETRKGLSLLGEEDTVRAVILVQLQHPEAQISACVKDCFKVATVSYYLWSVPVRADGLHSLCMLCLSVCFWLSLEIL